MRFALLLGSLFCFPAIAQTPVAGSTPASFRVTESGAAEYRIPLRVPPGIAGMEPRLALVYNSQAGNGLLGVGWSLEGLGAIKRCPRTLAQDGVRGGVNYDANDRFCLDGQRLVAIDGGYGANGTEYRTERESFSKIISYGEAGSGPAWFKVWTRSGEVMEYGNTTDSRIEARGKSSVRAWALSRISDRKGNDLTVTYNEDGVNGDFVPVAIHYAGNVVQLEYESRPDSVLRYQGGSVIRTTHRLVSVKPAAGATPAREYRLGYQQASYTQRSLITSLQECSGAACLPPTVLGWNPGGIGQYETAPSFGGPGPGQGLSYLGNDPERQKLVDVNGDGKVDLVHVNGAGGLVIHLNNGQGGFNAGASFNGLGAVGSEAVRQKFVDVDADGCVDLIHINGAGGVVVFRSDCNGAIHSLPSFGWLAGDGLSYLGPEPARQLFADVDGDGLPDLIHINGAGGAIVHLNNGQAGFQPGPSFGAAGPGQGLSYLGADPARQVFVDVNGDGCADWVHINGAGGAIVHLSNCAGAFHATPSFGGPGPGQGLSYLGADPARQIFLDLNGDGCADWIHVNGAGGLIVHPADCAGGFDAAPSFGGPGPGNGLSYLGSEPHRMKFADVNGDGLPDLIHVNGAGGIVVHLNHGAGGFRDSASFGGPGPGQGLSYLGPNPALQFFADVRGWGRADWVHVNGAGGVIVHPAAGYYLADALVAIDDGLGREIDIQFKPITDASVYSKDPAGTYPTLGLQIPIFVCSGHSVSSGADGLLLHAYLYGGARADLRGRGLLGFRWREIEDSESGLKLYTEYRQDWPYVGLPSLVRRTQRSGALLSQVSSSFGCLAPGSGGTCAVAPGNRYFPFVSQSIETGADLNGAALPALTTTTQYDAFGNPASITVSTPDGHGKTTTNTYMNDTVNWLPGRLLRGTVQSTGP
jgi:hypothetical protein